MAKDGVVENLFDTNVIKDVDQAMEGLSPALRTPFLLRAVLVELRILNGRTPDSVATKKLKDEANRVLGSINNFRV